MYLRAVTLLSIVFPRAKSALTTSLTFARPEEVLLKQIFENRAGRSQTSVDSLWGARKWGTGYAAGPQIWVFWPLFL